MFIALFERTPALHSAILISVVAFTVRTCVSLHPYSGAGKPPLYGDFEAQRHWMEITYNLPISEWYFNTSRNNLEHWGLDYPPLTAYHSWLCGAISSQLDPHWVALETSRGHESYAHKLFMRHTVLATDLLLYFTAVWAFVRVLFRTQPASHKVGLAAVLLLQPGLILIDHGHFQYNCASLGLALWGIVAVTSHFDLLGSIAFSLALNFKQMELYHSVPFFCYLLGKALRSRNPLLKVTLLGITVVTTFGVLWLPFLVDVETALQVLRRQFPFERGLFEDKVANLWCSISVLVKLHRLLSAASVLRLTLLTTVAAILPSSWALLRNPTPYTFILALGNSSLAFFLFSFQVHEKSILLAALPLSLLAHWHPFASSWFGVLASFSMYPLLTRDGLALPCWALSLLSFLFSLAFLQHWQRVSLHQKLLFAGCIGLLLATCSLSHLVTPPPKYPHLFPLATSVVSCVQLLGFLGYLHYLQFTAGGGKDMKTHNE
ncbi:hypothetical protein EMCRGX_G027600 [Ephydatia muelleri]|eukprot:Em0020g974a